MPDLPLSDDDTTADTKPSVWLAAAFEDSDTASAIFDDRGVCVAANTQFANAFFATGRRSVVGLSIGEFASWLANANKTTTSEDPSPRQILTLSRAISETGWPVPVLGPKGTLYSMICRPMGSGGRLVTFIKSQSAALEKNPSEAFEEKSEQATDPNALLRMIVESLGEGVALYDEDMRLLLNNAAYRRMAFFDNPAVPIGTHLADEVAYVARNGDVELPEGATPEEFAEGVVSAAKAYLKNIPFKVRGGRTNVASIFPSKAGGYVVSVRDITEIQSAEEKARRMLRDAVEALNEGLILFDQDMRMVFCNNAFRDLIFPEGLAPEPGVSLPEIAHAIADCGHFAMAENMPPTELAEKFIEAAKNFQKDLRVTRWDGKLIEGSVFPTPLGGYLHTAHDVTERVRIEEVTREAEDLLRTIVEASPSSFLVSRFEDGKVLYQPSPSVDEIGEIQSTEAIFVDPETRPRLRALLAEHGSVTDYPVELYQPDGSIMQGRTSARVVEFRGEKLVVASTRNVTEQLALEAELARQREAAHQNEKLSALGELLAGVAHELNNPLSVILGYALMLDGKVDDPIVKRRVREISVAADRCARIVRTFLDMARQRPSQLAPVSPMEMIETAVEVAGHGLRVSGIDIQIAAEADLPDVLADQDQMTQVFANLIVNAEQAMAEASAARLSISVARSDAAVVFEVADTGSGLDPAILSRIFDPYFTTKDVGDGTGIGLAFCQRIVTAHGGEITARNAPSGGAVFTVELPVAGPAKPQTPDDAISPSRAGSRILVVDDEESVSAMVRDILKAAGYRVDIAHDGDNALAACSATVYDAILCDVRMPGRNGTEVLAELILNGHPSAKHFAFLTGDALSPGIADRIAATGKPSIEKPARPETLLTMVAKLITGAA